MDPLKDRCRRPAADISYLIFGIGQMQLRRVTFGLVLPVHLALVRQPVFDHATANEKSIASMIFKVIPGIQNTEVNEVRSGIRIIKSGEK